MPIQTRRSLLSFMLHGAAFGFLFCTPARADVTLTFCYDPYPPYTLGTEGEAAGGINVILLQAVVEQIDGVTAKVELLPWKRCQAETKAGNYDGILPLFINEERETYLSFTRGAFEETSHFWFNRNVFPDGLEWNGDFSTVSHHRLGMLNGGFISQEMEDSFAEQNEILRARDIESLMQLLLKGRVDLIATDGTVGRYVLSQNGWADQIGAVQRPIDSHRTSFGLSKVTGADRYLEAFDHAIAALELSGRIEEIQRTEINPID